MKVCPNCGQHDNSLWENCRFKRDLDLMRIEDFKAQFPELACRIEKEDYLRVTTKFHIIVYHRSGKYVLRKELFDEKQPFWENFEAHHKRKTPISDWGNRRKKELTSQAKLATFERVKKG